jgi:Predicted membrane protein
MRTGKSRCPPIRLLGQGWGTIMLFQCLGFDKAKSEKSSRNRRSKPPKKKAKAARTAFLASRTNTMLSIPMLMSMVGAGHGFLM